MSKDGACHLMSGNMLSSQEAMHLLGKGQSYEMIEPNMPMTKGQTAGLLRRGLKGTAWCFSMDRGRADPRDDRWRTTTMDTTKERPTLATLQAQRQSLRRELAIVVKQIDQGERARARIAELIKLLEQGQHQAA